MRDEEVICVAGHPLLNRRCTRLPGCFYFPKRKLQLLKARYSLTVLKVPLNSNQSINQSINPRCAHQSNVIWVWTRDR